MYITINNNGTMKLRFVCITSLLAIAIGLSWQTAEADSSNVSEQQSPRRGNRIKRMPSGVVWTFSVKLEDPYSPSEFEYVALTGDIATLGAWLPQGSILLNRTERYNVWSVTVNVPANISISYRYFIAAIDRVSGGIQIRKWESHRNPRQLITSNTTNGFSNDLFGTINDVKNVKRGWLNSGNILQFKFFRNPIKFDDIPIVYKSSRISIRLVPVEFQDGLAPILPSAKANVEYVRMRTGDSVIRSQPDYGVPFATDDIVIFHATLADLDEVAYLLEIYCSIENSDVVHRLGYQYIYPDSISGSEGKLNITLLSSTWQSPIGFIEIQYLLIKPLFGPQIDFRTTFTDYWRLNWTNLNVGHRGLGKSLKQATDAASIAENTIASMNKAASLGADMVEFDIQLTSDYVPIVYHDFVILICMDPKTPTSKDDLTQVMIKDLTYEQLTGLATYQVVDSKIIEYPAHNDELREDYRLFPKFEDFLTKIDKNVGFDIEIKWPQLKSDGSFESTQDIDKNVYVDHILAVMLQKGCGRLSFFTSFDADICSLLRFKQNMYPVMFLSANKEDNFADPRSSTIRDTINNAQAFDLMGIVPHASFIAKNIKWVKKVHDADKKIFLWGGDLYNNESIEWFKSKKPTGVIFDRIDLILPAGHENIFSYSPELPELFQEQCPPTTTILSQDEAES